MAASREGIAEPVTSRGSHAVLAVSLCLITACSPLAEHEGLELPPAATLEAVLSDSDAVVRLRVETIEGPFWNSSDGHPWIGRVSDVEGVPGVNAWQYTRVRAHVEERWLGEELSGTIELIVFGDATKRWESDRSPPDRFSSSGGFIVDQVFVVALTKDVFSFEDRSEAAWTTAIGWQANWRVAEAAAIGSYTRWSMPLVALRDALTTAWNVTRDSSG